MFSRFTGGGKTKETMIEMTIFILRSWMYLSVFHPDGAAACVNLGECISFS